MASLVAVVSCASYEIARRVYEAIADLKSGASIIALAVVRCSVHVQSIFCDIFGSIQTAAIFAAFGKGCCDVSIQGFHWVVESFHSFAFIDATSMADALESVCNKEALYSKIAGQNMF